MPFVCCEQELPYCYRLLDAENAKMVAPEWDMELRYWLFDESYTNMYLLHGGTNRPRAIKTKVRQRTAVRNLVFGVRYHSKVLAALLTDHILYRITVVMILPNKRPLCVLWVPTPPMIAYYPNAFGDFAHWFGYSLLKAANMNLSFLSLFSFIQPRSSRRPMGF